MVSTFVIHSAVYTWGFTRPWDSTMGLFYARLYSETSRSSGEHPRVRETAPLDRSHIWL